MASKFRDFLKWWITPCGSAREPRREDGEVFKGVPVDPSAMREVLDATAVRRGAVLRVYNHLHDLPRQERYELIDRVILRFALYVLSLPASESIHHTKPFGLLDHSLEVAGGLLGDLANTNLASEANPVVNAEEDNRWMYAGFLAGLLHDVGRVLDVVVKAGEVTPAWEPEREPLAAYRRRWRLPLENLDWLSWIKGRGMDPHEIHILTFDRWILTAAAREYAGLRLALIAEAYRSGKPRQSVLHPNATLIAQSLRQRDKKDSRGGSVRAGKKHEEKEETTLPQEPTVGEEVAAAPEDDAEHKEETAPPAGPVEAPPATEEVSQEVQIPGRERLLDGIKTALGMSFMKSNQLFGHSWIENKYIWIDIGAVRETFLDLLRLSTMKRVLFGVIAALKREKILEPFPGGDVSARIRPGPDGEERDAIRVHRRLVYTDEELKEKGRSWAQGVTLLKAKEGEKKVREPADARL